MWWICVIAVICLWVLLFAAKRPDKSQQPLEPPGLPWGFPLRLWIVGTRYKRRFEVYGHDARQEEQLFKVYWLTDESEDLPVLIVPIGDVLYIEVIPGDRDGAARHAAEMKKLLEVPAK